MEIPEVSALPVLDQNDFPAFPEIPDGKILLCFGTEWQNAEKEFAAGCIVNACILAKKWKPVHGEQFFDRMKANPMIAPFDDQGVAHALWALVDDGYVEVVRFQDANHCVPTPRLANAVLADTRKLRIA